MTDTCVIFATASRSRILGETLATLSRQTVKPASVILSCVSSDDADVSACTLAPILVTGEMGLTRQRNTALRNLPRDAAYVAFFDDDFVPHEKWIEVVEATFRANPDIAVITGNVIADGINGPGLNFEQAEAMLRSASQQNNGWMIEPYSPYGCNMAFRRSAIEGIWFDERLVLYGWQEDRDFGAQVARRGRAVKLGAAMGVHLGVKSGRVSGVRLGYSQISNPVYLYRKGTMGMKDAAVHMFKNFASNLAKAFRPEPYIDRPGRLRGNFKALVDVSRGRISPEQVMTL